MELEQIHKYLHLNKQANGNVEVMYAGQPCLIVSEGLMGSIWRINPVFAKLVYGANVWEDIPQCMAGLDTTEDAIAEGLTKLYDLGAFQKEYDFPEDTYAATMKDIQESAKTHSLSKSANIFEASVMYKKLVRELQDFVTERDNDRSEYATNQKLTPNTGTKKIKIKNSAGQVVSTHDSESEAMAHYKSIPSNTGMKIVREEAEGAEADITTQLVESDAAYAKWEQDVKTAHPSKELKFKGRVEKGTDTVSAELTGVDRSFGVWDHATSKGTVFTPEKEAEEDKKVQAAIKKDKSFSSKK